MSIAVVKTGGKQYIVEAGDKIKVEKIAAKEGDNIKLDTLLKADNKGMLELGKPKLSSKVEAKLLKTAKSKKVLVTKYKSKTRYTRNVGHRQPYSQIEIVKL